MVAQARKSRARKPQIRHPKPKGRKSNRFALCVVTVLMFADATEARGVVVFASNKTSEEKPCGELAA